MKQLLNIVFFCLLAGMVAGQGFDPNELLRPQTGRQRLVTDLTGTLTADQQQALENKLVALDDSSFTQVAVVIIPSLNGQDPTDYATELGRAWGVGGPQNNGVVLLIAKNDRKLSIAPGYGLEGSLPDAMATHIIQDIIVPRFKGNDYYRGIEDGTDAIMAAVRGEYTDPRPRRSEGGGMSMGSILLMAIVIFILVSMMSRGGGGNSKGGGGTWMSRRGSRGFNGPIFIPGGFGGGGGGGFGGGFGGGGGGFGGFGGGSFGGGGSSGSW